MNSKRIKNKGEYAMRKVPHFHGSDLEEIEKYYGIPKETIVGFGANVNPLGISEAVKIGKCRKSVIKYICKRKEATSQGHCAKIYTATVKDMV